MPVDSTHPDYDRLKPAWMLMRDVLEGSITVKAKGDLYLPQLTGQSADEYASYRGRAQFFNASGRTHGALHGFIFRKDPQNKAPTTATAFLQDATMTGVAFYDYAKTIAHEVLAIGRGGTLIDFDGDAENRPYLVRYAGENVINWTTRRIRGRMYLNLLTLFEMSPDWIPLDRLEAKDGPPDQFEGKTWPQWRVYELKMDAGMEPYVVCTLWRKKEKRSGKEDEWVAVGQMNPTRRGRALQEIPFVFHNAADASACPGKIPLLDLAEVNLSHYRTSADYENACHMIGVPTPWVSGFKIEGKLALGTTTALVSEDANAKCGFLELEGHGMETLQANLDRKERQMAALGAKMLEPEAKKAEAYDTVAIRAAAESSSLLAIAVAVGQQLTAILQWVVWWMGTEDRPPAELKDVTVELNTEFVVGVMAAETLTALSGAYSAGAMPLEAYFFTLQRGEMLPGDMDLAAFKAALEEGPVGLPAMVPAGPPAAPGKKAPAAA